MKPTTKLRTLIKHSGKSQSDIARKSKVPQSTINTFVGGGDLRGVNIDKLAKYFGVELK